jgi:outer membrane lipoprotein-sorting protein
MFRIISLVTAIFLLPTGPTAPQANDVQAMKAKLNSASARFTSAEAKVHRENLNYLIKEVDLKQDGSLYIIRAKDGQSQFGLRTVGEDARTVEYKDGIIRVYNAKLNCYNTVQKTGIDSYLTLGFGASGDDLAKNWTIADMGPETIAGVKTEKLDLKPTDPAVAANVRHVTIWIDLDRDVSLKVVFQASNRDVSTATYSDIQLNPKKLNLGEFAIQGKPCR